MQAPMAGGATSAALVAAASKSGCLGSIGAGYTAPSDLRRLIYDVREEIGTNRPFQVNLMVPGRPVIDRPQIQRMLLRLKPYYDELGLALPGEPSADPSPTLFQEQVSVLLEERAPVVSFVFGIPPDDVLSALRANGAFLFGTATSVDEGTQLQARGLDAVVAQGGEAGGHRGSFTDVHSPVAMPLDDLLPQMTSALSLPVIAAGGIMTGGQITGAMRAGAAAVQLGTAFLDTHESGVAGVYKKAMLGAADDNSKSRTGCSDAAASNDIGANRDSTATADATELTRAFTGRWARGLCNRFLSDFRECTYGDIPDYPLQNALTAPLRKAAAAQGRPELLSLWAGTGHGLCRSESVADLVQRLNSEYQEAIGSTALR